MGYTHYYLGLGSHDPQKWQEIFPSLVEDTQKLVQAFGPDLIGDPAGNGGSPILTNDKISFNGGWSDCHEHFTIKRDGHHTMGFTKTRLAPYDVVVTAVLLRACFRLGKDSIDAASIGSDGYWEDWSKGRDLVKKVFPDDEIVKPPRIAEEEVKDEEDNDDEAEKEE